MELKERSGQALDTNELAFCTGVPLSLFLLLLERHYTAMQMEFAKRPAGES